MKPGIHTLPAERQIARRFVAKLAPGDNCWLWTGHIDKQGYARLRGAGGRNAPVLYAHRFSYEFFVAPVPLGLTIDHLCRIRHCVNPAHLEPVTQRENMLRGESPGARAVRRGTCQQGHTYDYVTPSGTHRCRQCDNATSRRRWHRKRKMAGA